MSKAKTQYARTRPGLTLKLIQTRNRNEGDYYNHKINLHFVDRVRESEENCFHL